MQKQLTLILLFVVGITISCQTQEKIFTLQDYYSNDSALAKAVDEVYNDLSEQQRVAQMIVTSLGKLGKPYEQVEPLIKEQKVGGIIFLSGDPEQFKKDIASIQEMSMGFPLLMSMDAEPSLFNRRMPGTPEMKPTAELKTSEEIRAAVSTIDKTLQHVGFAHNYAPVIDVSPNNEAIGNRTLGSDSLTIVPLAISFIEETQKDQIIATAKHFPGHGRVSGDTHKKLVYIDGELTEVSLYKPIIEAGVLSIMVGHIAVENNPKYGTNGMPSTLSPIIVTSLLRKEMSFNGLIITDAMNMGAVQAIPNSTLLAAKAGCDIILMPPNEVEALESIISEMDKDEAFKQQIEASVKRIIRAKICLGMEFKHS
jgi:beta-N-acetylhexosaminidase